MTTPSESSVLTETGPARRHPVAVRAPARHDGIGRALRRAFGEERGDIPEDWLRIIRTIR
jgi:hypothetical protein